MSFSGTYETHAQFKTSNYSVLSCCREICIWLSWSGQPRLAWSLQISQAEQCQAWLAKLCFWRKRCQNSRKEIKEKSIGTWFHPVPRGGGGGALLANIWMGNCQATLGALQRSRQWHHHLWISAHLENSTLSPCQMQLADIYMHSNIWVHPSPVLDI